MLQKYLFQFCIQKKSKNNCTFISTDNFCEYLMACMSKLTLQNQVLIEL